MIAWTRRTLARTSLLAMAASMLASGGGAADPVKIRISTPAVPGDWHADMLTIFEKEVEAALPGQFDVEIYLSGTLFKQGAEPAAMQRGNLDMALISAQDISKQIPAWSIFTAGYLIRDPEHQQKVFKGEIGKEMYGLVEKEMGIHILDVGYLGTRQVNLRSRREVKTPADLAGVKLRMPASDTWMFLGTALGASPTPVAFNEIYLALQTGTVDGQDNPLPTVEKAKFYEVTEQIVMTSHLVDGVFFSIANSTWDKLSAEQKVVFEKAAASAIAFNNENRIKDEARLVQLMKDKGLTVTEPDVAAFRKAVQEAYLGSELSKDWPQGLLERVNAVQ